VDPKTDALLEVTRRHTRALSKQLRLVSRLHAQLADHLDEVAAQTAQPEEAQRNDDDPQDEAE
jgi:hypothetical protein